MNISQPVKCNPSKQAIPKHIAIIMDGNNRYGKANSLGLGVGHIKGKDALNPIVKYCLSVGVQVLTVFAFSSENWQRPWREVELLMQILEQSIYEQMPQMYAYQIRLQFIGDRSRLATRLQKLMAQAEQETAHFTTMTLVIAISYGGQWDIAHSTKKIAAQVLNQQLAIDDIDEALVNANLELSGLPAVDMLIRTGGEYRLSNFLLWQAAYAELFFTQTLWPEFTSGELDAMVSQFALRQRRFGKTSEQIDMIEIESKTKALSDETLSDSVG